MGIDYLSKKGNGIFSSELKFYDGNGFEIKNDGYESSGYEPDPKKEEPKAEPEPNCKTSMTGKDLVNKFYQPLGHLKCGVSSDALWDHAKQMAIDVTEMILQEHPMYTEEWQKWNTIKNEIMTL